MAGPSQVDIGVAEQGQPGPEEAPQDQPRTPEQGRPLPEDHRHQRRDDQGHGHHVGQGEASQEGQQVEETAGPTGIPVPGLSPEQIDVDQGQGLGHRAAVLLRGGGVVPEKVGEPVESGEEKGQGPVPCRPLPGTGQAAEDAVEEPQGQQGPKRAVAAQDGDGVGQGIPQQVQQPSDAVEPEPAPHGVEGIAGGVAGASLDLGVLVGDEVAPLQLVGLEPGVQGGQVEGQEEGQQQATGPGDDALLGPGGLGWMEGGQQVNGHRERASTFLAVTAASPGCAGSWRLARVSESGERSHGTHRWVMLT